MTVSYQEADWRVADYEAFCLDPEILDPTTSQPLRIRGPRPQSLEPGSYFVCLGAAQSFGRFCRDPFPSLLSRRLALPVLNISHGGAGPSFFLGSNTRLIELINGARFVVIQVMSGRSESNSLFLSKGVGHYERRSDGSQIGCDEAFNALLASSSREQAKRIVQETRDNWLASYRSLLTPIRVPTILFWFSTREPNYQEGWTRGNSWRNREKLFGAYPQLVNRAMVNHVRQRADKYVQCVSQRGMPQSLFDRFTGEQISVSDEWSLQPWTENWYYPSPEMHEDAADALEGPARALLAGRRHQPGWWRRWQELRFSASRRPAALPPG